MYSEFFKKSKRKSIVIYEDQSGRSEKIEKRWNSKLNWGIDLTKGFKSILLKNYSKILILIVFFKKLIFRFHLYFLSYDQKKFSSKVILIFKLAFTFFFLSF